MTRRLAILALGVLAGAGLTTTTPAGAAGPKPPPSGTQRTHMSPAACSRFIALGMAAPATKRDAATTTALQATLAAGCPLTYTVTTTPVPIDAPAATWCAIREADEWIGPLGVAARWSARGELCGNGASVWANWGPNCGGWVAPAYYSGYSWCGHWSNSASFIDIGSNWYLGPWFAPWVHFNYWVRNQIYANGNQSGSWGG